MGSKLRSLFQILRYLVYSVYFNFKHLPFSQAKKLPILLYKPTFLKNTGKYIITGPVSFGMIRLGFPTVSIFTEKGIVLENRGVVEFKGKALFGNGSALSIGSFGVLTLGNHVEGTCGTKIVCYSSIKIEDYVKIGWNCLFLDTDFHSLKAIDSGIKSKGYGAIQIGSHSWICAFCRMYKNTILPSWSVVASNTVVNNTVTAQPYSLIFNPNKTHSKYIGKFLDWYDDRIDYL